MLEKLTMPFEKSGSIVQCHPVENSPLSVKAELRPVQHLDWMSKAGSTSQITTTGANIFTPSDANTAHKGVVALSTGLQLSMWGSPAISHEWVIANLKPSTTYYIKCRIKKVKAPDAEFTEQKSLDKRLYLYTPVGEKSVTMLNWNASCTVGEEKVISTSFTTPDVLLDESLKYSIYGYSERWLNAEGTGGTATVDFNELIISETDVPYEPYTGREASPSPNYPQMITDSIPAGSYYVISTAPEGGYWKIVLDEALGSVGSYQDTLEVDAYTGKYRLIRETGRRSFDGTEEWYTNNGRNYVALGGWCNHEEDDTGQTDHGQKCSHAIYGNDNDTGRYLTHKSGSVSWILFGGTADVQAWKDFLAQEYEAGRPVTANFGRATPIITTGQAVLVNGTVGLTALSAAAMGQTVPAPDHPASITIIDQLKVHRSGKNFMPDILEYGKSQTQRGVTIARQADGAYVLNGTATEHYNFEVSNKGRIPTGKYFICANSSSVAEGGFQIYSVTEKIGMAANFGVTVPRRGYIFPDSLIRIHVDPGASYDNVIVRPMITVLEEDAVLDNSAAYEPYIGDRYDISLPEGFVGGSIDVAGGSITSRMAQYQFTGDESFNYSGSQVAGYVTVYTAAISPSPLYTPYAKILPSCTVAKGSMGIVGAENQFALNSNTSHFLRLSTGALTGYSDDWTEAEKVAGVKAYLKEQYDAGTPVTVFYEVSETVETTTPQVISAQNGVNTIYSNAESVTVSGRESPIHTIQSLTERIAALETAATTT